MFSLTNKIAVVTGAARGLGLTIAIELSKLGAKVIATDVDVNQLEKSAAENKEYNLDFMELDVTNVSDIKSVMESINSKYGGIDILVNNAGILGSMSIEEMDKEKEWDRVLEVNLSGTFFVSQGALPYIKESKNGRIINISSVSGRNGGFESPMSYTAAKGGVVALTRGMARHLAPYNITVNAVCPGATETEILKGFTEEQLQSILQYLLLNRLGKPIEVAAAVCYLASDEAGFVTGLMLDVNGGGYFG
ncbi:MAG TPA: 3-oxoacyl-ACP reductase FabG [Clostridiaceae bacterium]|nr:3-oxoacyl-ACP reductase FabG [Clostridiaceae bacterium]